MMGNGSVGRRESDGLVERCVDEVVGEIADCPAELTVLMSADGQGCGRLDDGRHGDGYSASDDRGNAHYAVIYLSEPVAVFYSLTTMPPTPADAWVTMTVCAERCPCSKNKTA